ncbi:MAG: hypothetical protein HUU16_07995 [Candidatus Omnitrophica bacterium]|nr:hypothetical protein [bacterium]NUN96102.1 hypothetical protein [Candidatus Omnitrophota bacterium]
MKKAQATNPALQLANLVLNERIPLDEGIVRAQTGGILLEFIQGLNVLTGGTHFSIDEIKNRVRSGDALRALQGRIPLLELPPEIRDSEQFRGMAGASADHPHDAEAPHKSEGEEPENAEEKEEEARARALNEISEIAKKVRALREERREHSHQISFIEAVERQKTIRPKPWVAGMIIAVVTMLLAGPVFLVVASPLALLVFISVGLGLAAIVVQRETVWYRHEVKIETSATEQRRAIKEIHRKQISRIEDEILELRNSARPILETTSESQRHLLETSFPEVFGKL